MSKIYTCTTVIGSAEIILSTDDADFMEWYLTKDDIKVEVDAKIHCDEKYDTVELDTTPPFRDGKLPSVGYEEIEKAFRDIDRGIPTSVLSIDGDGFIKLKVAGYELTSRV